MIIADTGFWVALFNQRDPHHQKVRIYAPFINEPFTTTLPVVTEVCHLLQKYCNPLKATVFLNEQRAGLFSLFTINESHLSRIVQLMKQYADLPMDLANASLVLSRRIRGWSDCFY